MPVVLAGDLHIKDHAGFQPRCASDFARLLALKMMPATLSADAKSPHRMLPNNSTSHTTCPQPPTDLAIATATSASIKHSTDISANNTMPQDYTCSLATPSPQAAAASSPPSA